MRGCHGHTYGYFLKTTFWIQGTSKQIFPTITQNGYFTISVLSLYYKATIIVIMPESNKKQNKALSAKVLHMCPANSSPVSEGAFDLVKSSRKINHIII